MMKIKLILLIVFFALNLNILSSEISIVAVGDIMLDRFVGKNLSDSNTDYPFKQTRNLIYESDIAFANLESPISKRGKKQNKKYCFKAKPIAAKILKNAGFDVLSLANNHIMDYGDSAMLDTIDLLKKYKICSVGAGKNLKFAQQPVILKVKNLKIAFFAYNCTYPFSVNAQQNKPGANPSEIENIKTVINTIRDKVDIIIVSFHWGIEYNDFPEKWQIKLAHQAIEAGADIILGHHPHILQGVEFYHGKPIFYSLGNFVFDQNLIKTRESIAVKFIFENKNDYKIYAFPILIGKYLYYPDYAKGDEKDKIISRFINISKKLNGNPQNLKRVIFK